MDELREKVRKNILSLDLGYKYQMSDYAGSREEETHYEEVGLKQVDEAVTEIMALIDSYAEKEVEKATAPILRAWKVEGVRPDYHHAQQERLRNEWPMLYQAIKALGGKPEGKPNE